MKTSNLILIKLVKKDPSKELNTSSINTIKMLKKGISLLYWPEVNPEKETRISDPAVSSSSKARQYSVF